MRADSLRDFYAKTLAVVGLGLLAGAGAIVDYWPVGGPLPAVTHVAGLNAVGPMKLPGAPASIPAPTSLRTSVRPAPPVVIEAGANAALASIAVVLPPAPLVVTVASELPEGLNVDLSDTTFLFVPDAIEMKDLGPAPHLATDDATDDAHTILQGALRVTRESLRGARGYLGDKISGVMGAFKRVSPFWDASGPAFAPR